TGSASGSLTRRPVPMLIALLCTGQVAI
ncbi:MAG: hypothetical protein QOD04_3054, partial [Pseudonocardiales bacterium]|nr:hypothetical protein [Pseudonocardiales bacterium]